MGKLLLILFIVFIVIPIVRVLWKLYLLRRNAMDFQRRAREMFEQQFGGSYGGNGYGSSFYGSETYDTDTEPRRSEPRRRRRFYGKKIGADVGEYVSFEELPPRADSNTARPSGFRTEEQIEDADWEDIR
ncbi:MAG: DUF4834 family protein [Muribaculaceae bacterium]|nr:DUF4834 family protein [Muribaculaceae bacterium]